MNKAEMLEALQKQTKLRPTHVKRVVDAIFDPQELERKHEELRRDLAQFEADRDAKIRKIRGD